MAKSLTLTIQADDETLVRLATLLCWANPEKPRAPREVPSLFEEGMVTLYTQEWLREEIVKLLPLYVEVHGKEATRAVLKAHGGERVSTIPPERYEDLLGVLQSVLPPPIE